MGLVQPHTYDIWHFDASSGFHDHTNDTLAIVLSNRTPQEANDVDHGDVEEIDFGFGYDGPIDTQNFELVVGPIYQINAKQILIIATGGTIGPFRTMILQNNDLIFGLEERLLCYWPFGEEFSILDGGSFEILWQGFPDQPPSPFDPAMLSIF